MVKTMDNGSILFVRGDKGVGYNMAYYQANFGSLPEVMDDPQHIFYKTSEGVWIDFKRAVQTNTGSLSQRIAKASADGDYRIDDLRLIPESHYYDVYGYRFEIAPYDGIYNSTHWLERVQYDYDAVKFELSGDDLRVTFGEKDNINEAFISLNGLFFPFVRTNLRTVVFRDVKPHLVKVATVGEEAEHYDLRVQAYSWKGLNKLPAIFPQRRESQWLVMERAIGQNYIVIYRNVMYEYETHPTDPRRVRILGMGLAAIDVINLNDVYFYEMKSTAPNYESRKYISRGVSNKYRDSVDFPLPIYNSMILFNGVDSEFEIQDVNAIHYPRSFYSVNGVANLSFVAQVNFTRG